MLQSDIYYAIILASFHRNDLQINISSFYCIDSTITFLRIIPPNYLQFSSIVILVAISGHICKATSV